MWGIPIQIKDGRNGFLVEPHDAEKFAEKIIEILQEPELAKEMGENGKEMVGEREVPYNKTYLGSFRHLK